MDPLPDSLPPEKFISQPQGYIPIPDSTSIPGHHIELVHLNKDFAPLPTTTLPTEPLHHKVQVLDHYDSMDPARAVITTISDSIPYLTIVNYFFNVPEEQCLAGGILANVAQAVVNSPYVASKVKSFFPATHHITIENIDALVRQHIDPDYMAYYTIGWPVLGFATIPETFCFILASALIKKRTALLISSSSCQQPLDQQVARFNTADPSLEMLQTAFMNVVKGFTPELAASLTRSGLANLYQHYQGKQSAEDVISKTALSVTLFVGGTFLYYLCYRLLEQAGRSGFDMHQEPAQKDLQNIEKLKTELSSLQADLSPRENRSVTKQKSPSPISQQEADTKALQEAFGFLKSPLISLFKDPLYRSFIVTTHQFRKDPYSENAIQAFRAIDILELAQKFISSLEADSIREEQLQAINTIFSHLGVEQEFDPENPAPSQLQNQERKGLAALKDLFETQTSRHSSSITGDRDPLLSKKESLFNKTYGATSSDRVSEVI